MTIYILTLANKPRYLPDAIASADAQTREHDVEHIVELDTGRGWGGKYPPAVFFNETAEGLPQDSYIAWLSDDDLLLPHYVERLAGYLEAHEEVGCCYGGSEVVLEDVEGNRTGWGWLPSSPMDLFRQGWPTFHKQYQPACVIDGGQIMVRRSVLDLIEQPWMDESPEPWQARLTDGHVMNKIANQVGIYPVPVQVMVNRITPESAHCQPQGTERAIVDWREARKWNETKPGS